MALTEAQRVKIRVALGYPALFRQEERSWMVPLEMAMGAIDTFPETQTEIEGWLAKIDDVDNTRLPDALDRLMAHRVGGIELRDSQEIEDLKHYRKYCAQKIAAILGVEFEPPIGRGGDNRVQMG